jgi:hypothetical protein
MKSRSLVLGTAVALVAMALAGCAEKGGKNADKCVQARALVYW